MNTKKLSKKQLLNKSKKRFAKKSRSIKRKLRKLTKLKGGASASASASSINNKFDTILLPYEITYSFFTALNLSYDQRQILTKLIKNKIEKIENMPYNPAYFAKTLELTPKQIQTYYNELDKQEIPRPSLSHDTHGIIHPSKLIPRIFNYYFVEGQLNLTRMQLKALKNLENDIKLGKLTNEDIITGLNFSPAQIKIYEQIRDEIASQERNERLARFARIAQIQNNGTNPYVPFGLVNSTRASASASRELPRASQEQFNPFLMTPTQLEALQQSQLNKTLAAELSPRGSRAPPLPPPRASASASASRESASASRASENTIPPKHWNPFAQSEPKPTQHTAKVRDYESIYNVMGTNSPKNNSNTLLSQIMTNLYQNPKTLAELQKKQEPITYKDIKALIPPDFAEIYNEYPQYIDELLQELNKHFNKPEPVYEIPTSTMPDFPIKIMETKLNKLRNIYSTRIINVEDIKSILNSELSHNLNNEVRQFFVNTKGQINNKQDAVKALVAQINEWFKQEQEQKEERDSNA
jgi:hypothetical protein